MLGYAPAIEVWYFALRPDPEACEAIYRFSASVRASLRSHSRLIDPERLHLSLCEVGRPVRQRAPLDISLERAAAQVKVPAFEMTLDRLLRFKAGDSFPIVLTTSDQAACIATQRLRGAIVDAQYAHGLRASRSSRMTPHVTLFRDSHVAELDEPVPPIRWTADEFVLIRSFFGQSRHELMGSWRLAGLAGSGAV